MIAPLTPYAIRGVIWYQGEANVDRAYQYRTLFPLMIRDWRRCWGQGNFPFLFVQLANYRGAPPSEPVESAWAELREAQLMALSSPQTGMAVAIDLGKAETIHPKNKQDVGRRLAQIARAEVYGESITYSGPTYRCMGTEGSAIRIHFDHVDGGLATREGRPLTGFAIAGKDRHFVWADAAIEGNTVVVRSPWVPEPVAVRYAWASNPACNLINQAGLPASPFRTDDWPGSTFHARCPAKP
jgi:sialate O-acetylesterase